MVKREYGTGGSFVFVQGFDFGTTDKKLKAHMGSVGTVTNIRWETKGSAEVHYSSPEEAAAAVEQLENSKIEGQSRFINVYARADGEGRPAKFIKTGGAYVFVQGFDFGTTEKQLKAHMGSVGTVTNIRWDTKGSAEVHYSSPEEAAAAVEQLEGSNLEGQSRFINVYARGEDGGPPKHINTGGSYVFVQGFDFGTTEKQLKAHMGSVGKVTNIRWETKGSAEVHYSSPEEAAAAVEQLEGSNLEGQSRFINVYARGEDSRPTKRINTGGKSWGKGGSGGNVALLQVLASALVGGGNTWGKGGGGGKWRGKGGTLKGK